MEEGIKILKLFWYLKFYYSSKRLNNSLFCEILVNIIEWGFVQVKPSSHLTQFFKNCSLFPFFHYNRSFLFYFFLYKKRIKIVTTLSRRFTIVALRWFGTHPYRGVLSIKTNIKIKYNFILFFFPKLLPNSVA